MTTEFPNLISDKTNRRSTKTRKISTVYCCSDNPANYKNKKNTQSVISVHPILTDHCCNMPVQTHRGTTSRCNFVGWQPTLQSELPEVAAESMEDLNAIQTNSRVASSIAAE